MARCEKPQGIFQDAVMILLGVYRAREILQRV